MHLRPSKKLGLTFTIALAVILLLPAAAISKPDHDGANTVADVEFLGEVVIPTGATFEGTEIGGLSSISYDPGRGV